MRGEFRGRRARWLALAAATALAVAFLPAAIGGANAGRSGATRSGLKSYAPSHAKSVKGTAVHAKLYKKPPSPTAEQRAALHDANDHAAPRHARTASTAKPVAGGNCATRSARCSCSRTDVRTSDVRSNFGNEPRADAA